MKGTQGKQVFHDLRKRRISLSLSLSFLRKSSPESVTSITENAKDRIHSTIFKRENESERERERERGKNIKKE